MKSKCRTCEHRCLIRKSQYVEKGFSYCDVPWVGFNKRGNARTITEAWHQCQGEDYKQKV